MARVTREKRPGHETGQYKGNRVVTQELARDAKFFSLVPCPSESHPLAGFYLHPAGVVKSARLCTITQTVPEPPTPGGGLPSRWFMILLLAGGEEELDTWSELSPNPDPVKAVPPGFCKTAALTGSAEVWR